MPKIKGNNLILFVRKEERYKAFAFSTTCEIDIQADTITVGSPDTGQWEKKKKRRKRWKISSGYLVGNSKQVTEVYNMLLSDTPVAVMLGTVADHAHSIDADDYVTDNELTMKGEALITRMTITGRTGDFVTMSMELEGCSSLELSAIIDLIDVYPVNLDFGTSLEPMKVVVASKRPWKAYILNNTK